MKRLVTFFVILLVSPLFMFAALAKTAWQMFWIIFCVLIATLKGEDGKKALEQAKKFYG